MRQIFIFLLMLLPFSAIAEIGDTLTCKPTVHKVAYESGKIEDWDIADILVVTVDNGIKVVEDTGFLSGDYQIKYNKVGQVNIVSHYERFGSRIVIDDNQLSFSRQKNDRTRIVFASCS